jgi:hypothetical protein
MWLIYLFIPFITTGSFFGFDHQLQGSSKYSVYTRDDPFPR